MTEEFSAEESAAIEAMQSEEVTETDDTPSVALEEPEAVEASEPDADEAKPEFKTTREKPPEGFVPHQAMHQERMMRQEAERKLAQFEAMIAQQQAEAQKAQEPQWTDPLIDPDGFKKYDDFRTQRLERMVQQQQQAFQARQAQEARQADVTRAEMAFKQETPDYDDAVSHVAEARKAELRMYGLDEQQIARQIMQDANGIYDSAKRMNMNPAQLMYQIAQQRGYQARQVQDEQARVEALAEAQRQTQGLGSGGSRQAGRLTMTQLSEMSEAELGALMAKDPDAIARAMGG